MRALSRRRNSAPLFESLCISRRLVLSAGCSWLIWKPLQPNEVITTTVEVRDTEYAIYDVKPEHIAAQPK